MSDITPQSIGALTREHALSFSRSLDSALGLSGCEQSEEPRQLAPVMEAAGLTQSGPTRTPTRGVRR